MIDIHALLEGDAAEWNSTDPGSVSDLDQMVATAIADSSRPRLRRWSRLAAPALAAVVVAVVVLSMGLAGGLRSGSHPPVGSSGAPTSARLTAISGVTWTDPNSPGTVVYLDGAVRVFDGCTNTLAVLRISGDSVSIGPTLGPISTCTGQPELGGSDGAKQRLAQQRLQHFHRVVAGPATWARTGNTLTLRAPGQGALALVTDGTRAPQATGTMWRLRHYVGLDQNAHPYTGNLTLNITADGKVQASDGCAVLTGTAIVALTTIRFDARPHTSCPGRPEAVTKIIDAVLTGTAQYAVRGKELVISLGTQPGGQFLVYDAIS